MLPVIALAIGAVTVGGVIDSYLTGRAYEDIPAPPMPPAPRPPAGADRGPVTRPDAVDEVVNDQAERWKQRNKGFFERLQTPSEWTGLEVLALSAASLTALYAVHVITAERR